MMCANHNDRENVAFCQNCGKPLCQECTRTVGSAVFCEPCLAAKLSGAVPPPPAGAGWQPVSGGTAYTAVPPVSSGPNPGLAGLLGVIPGVGAMYNGQFAKGIVHLAIFAVLASMSDHVNGFFGIFVAGWIFYMVFDAYQTAKARREGTPLPDPFGLNDVGEKFGFGKTWPANHATGPAGPVPPPSPEPVAPPPPPAGWSSSPYTPPAANYSVPPVPPVPPATPAYDPNWQPAPVNRFPTGAIWLIGLGVIFLIGSSGILGGMSMNYLWPFLIIGFGIWIFLRKMTESGLTLGDDGSLGYRLRVLRAFRGSVWIILVGVLFFLNQVHVLTWGHSWPIFLIVVGLLAIAERAAYSDAAAAQYYTQPAAPGTTAAAPTGPPTVPSSGTESVDHEGEAR
ncbi:B-box zinc finger protein [Terriglobus sp. 2YAB30_2]|uniref:B-box zinc finger protein n=1 Tax=Terriglobus sp. 2YAB30_2 TaxID=3233023 RepID=UPI003F9A8F7D